MNTLNTKSTTTFSKTRKDYSKNKTSDIFILFIYFYIYWFETITKGIKEKRLCFLFTQLDSKTQTWGR